MRLTKVEVYERLLDAGQRAGCTVGGEKWFRDRVGGSIARYRRTWPDGTMDSGGPDCVWFDARKRVVAAFEVEGYDVEDKYGRGLHKDYLTLSCPELATAPIRVIILFGARAGGGAKNSLLMPGDEVTMQGWYRKRADALYGLYGIDKSLRLVLDTDLNAPFGTTPTSLLDTWRAEAEGASGVP